MRLLATCRCGLARTSIPSTHTRKGVVDVSLYGLGSFYQMIAMGMTDGPTLLTCSILTLVLTILVCVVGMPRSGHSGARGMRAFLNFDRLVVASIFKFFYVLLAVGMLVFTVGGFVYFCVQSVAGGYGSYYGAGTWALLVLFVIVTLVLAQIVLRVSFELAMLMVKLVENVAAIKGRLERMGDESKAPASDAPSTAGPASYDPGVNGAQGGWYGQGAAAHYPAEGYGAGAAGAAAGAAVARNMPPEPVAVARGYAPEPPASWQGEPAYHTQAGYASGGYGHASSAAGASHDGYGDAAHEGFYDGRQDSYAPSGYERSDDADDGYADADYAEAPYEGAYDEPAYASDDAAGAGATGILGAHGALTTTLPAAGRTSTLPTHATVQERGSDQDPYDDDAQRDAGDGLDSAEQAYGPADVVASHDDGTDEGGAWDCSCGARGNTGNFCAHCGQPRPEGDAQ